MEAATLQAAVAVLAVTLGVLVFVAVRSWLRREERRRGAGPAWLEDAQRERAERARADARGEERRREP